MKVLRKIGRQFFEGAFALSFVTLLGGCGCPTPTPPIPTPPIPTPKGVIYYFISAPINSDKAIEAARLLQQIGDDGDTQLISPDNTYTIIELCPSVNFPQSGVTLLPNSDRSVITESAIASLKEVWISKDPSDKSKTKKCLTTFESTIEVSKNLTNAAQTSGDKPIVILWQIPWNIKNASEESQNKLKEQIDKLSQYKSVKSVVIFGADQFQTDKMSMLFGSFQKQDNLSRFYVSTEIRSTLEHIKTVRNNLIKQ